MTYSRGRWGFKVNFLKKPYLFGMNVYDNFIYEVCLGGYQFLAGVSVQMPIFKANLSKFERVQPKTLLPKTGFELFQ